MKKFLYVAILLVASTIVIGCHRKTVEFVSNRPVEPSGHLRETIAVAATSPDTITVGIADALAVQNGLVVWLSISGLPSTAIVDRDRITMAQAIAGRLDSTPEAFDIVDLAGRRIVAESAQEDLSRWPEMEALSQAHRDAGAVLGPQIVDGDFTLPTLPTTTPGVLSQMLTLYTTENLSDATIALGTSASSLEHIRQIDELFREHYRVHGRIVVLPNNVPIRTLHRPSAR